MIQAYQKLLARLKAGRVCNPKKHILDNEASAVFKKGIREQCQLKLVPPDINRRLIPEQAIQTFKDHCIAILFVVAERNQFDKSMKQAVLKLTLLRQSNVTPKISAYTYWHGPIDYDKISLAP